MRIHIVEDYKRLSLKAATIIASQINLKPDSVLGLATGSTPLGMYKKLVQMYDDDLVDFCEVSTFNLDEYLGLETDHPQSYNYYMYNNFFKYINIARENINIPNGKIKDVSKFVKRYDKKIQNYGGIDLQILGIGHNGHIGFNEPDDALRINTHVVKLTEDTVKCNSRFFNNISDVPQKAISMGMGAIMKAKKILLLANGESKADAIKRTLNGKITTEVPSSLLQLHNDVTIIIDKKSAKYL